MKKIVSEWIDYAEGDLQAATVLFSEYKPRYEIIAYHCQQAAEKFLKALYVNCNRKVPRIHDLRRIIDDILDLYPALSEIQDICDRLTLFGVATRYPGVSMTVGEEHMDFLFRSVNIVKARILSILSPETD